MKNEKNLKNHLRTPVYTIWNFYNYSHPVTGFPVLMDFPLGSNLGSKSSSLVTSKTGCFGDLLGVTALKVDFLSGVFELIFDFAANDVSPLWGVFFGVFGGSIGIIFGDVLRDFFGDNFGDVLGDDLGDVLGDV